MNRPERRFPSARPPWLSALGCAGIVCLAVLFRLSDLGARNLWSDEAWVALAALKPSAAEALAAGQSTPPFYLLGVWLLARLFGSGEVVLRALSFAFGVGTVLLFWPLARRLAPPAAAWIGWALVAVSPVLVYFSKELKQYSGDAFFAVLAALLTERFLERPGAGRLALLAVAGVVGLGFSHPLIFVLPAVGVAALGGAPPPWRRWLVAVGVLWGLSFGGCYLLFFRHQVNPELVSYWRTEFPDFSGVTAFLTWLGGAWSRYFHYFFGAPAAWWAPGAVAAGLMLLPRPGRGRLLLYWGGPLVLAFVAAALHRYPFMANYNGSRLLLFSAPFLYLAAASGAAALVARLQDRRRLAAGAVSLAFIFSLNPGEMVRENLHPTLQRRQITPLLARLEAEAGPRDLVYVYYYAVYPFRYYRPDFPPERVRFGSSCHENGLFPDDGEEDDDDEFPARVWLLAAHHPGREFLENFALGLLGQGWRQTALHEAPGAMLFCYERETRFTRRGPKAAGPQLSGGPVPPSGRVFE